MKKHFLFSALIICLMSLNPSFSQEMPKITPPSPEAASLGKFSEVPISYYTGLPSISVPITSIDLDGESIPISLAYQSRGIMVEEIAPRVGIGWALDAGGAITRKARGKSDEDPFRGYLTHDVYADNDIFTSVTYRQGIASQYTDHPDFDFTPDVFIVQAPGLNFRFMIDRTDGQPVLQKYGDVEVSYTITGGKIDHFVVTNDKGFTYYFGLSKDGLRNARDIETIVQNISVPQNGSPDITAPDGEYYPTYNSWKLMDIEAPNGTMVHFDYDYEEPIFYRRTHDLFQDNVAVSYITKVRSKQYQINEITYDNGKITFQKEVSERQDLDNAYALDRINIYDAHNTLIKYFDLGYVYSDCVDDSNQLYYLKSSEPQADKRLMLDHVEEHEPGGNAIPPYTFEYDATPLPNRFSNSQDFWGYYNGKDNGSYLTFFPYGVNPVNRTVDTLKAMAGILKKITYPTGGSTEFTYEHNRAKPNGQLADLFFAAVNPEQEFNAGLSHLEHNEYYDGNIYSKPVSIGPTLIGPVHSSIWFTDETNCSETTFNVGCKFQVMLESTEPGGSNYQLFIGDHDLFIPAGDYDLIVDPQGPHDPLNMNDGFLVSLTWTGQVIDESEEIYTSGKRIKKIEYFDENQQLTNYRSFEYKDANGDCSGELLGMPAFYEIDQDMSSGFTVLVPSGSVPGSPLSTAQGNTIGYTYVTEYIGDSSDNVGKTRYEFSTYPDSGLYMDYPYHVPNDHEWLRGLPLSTEAYRRETNGTYTLVRKTENNYLYGNDFLPSGPLPSSPNIFAPIPVFKNLNENITNPSLMYSKTGYRYRFPLVIFYLEDPTDPFSDIYYETYYQTGGTLDKLSTEETLYVDGGDPVVTTTLYGFNYDSHYQPYTISTSTSEDAPIVQRFTYPVDLASPTVAEQTLNSQNRLVPINIDTYRDLDLDGNLESNELTGSLKNNYADFGNGITEIDTVLASVGGNPLEARVVYHGYYSNGKVKEVSKKDGSHIVYIWGYNEAYPVAKIENATYSQVSGYVSSIQFESNLDDDHCLDSGTCDEKSLRTQLNALRSALPDAMITTYTYDPLVGLTSITDPKGYTTYYEYDEFNRLKQVKDASGNILSENTYHYKQ